MMKELLKIENTNLLKFDGEMPLLTSIDTSKIPERVFSTLQKIQAKEINYQKEKMNRLKAQSDKALEMKKAYEEHVKLYAFS